MKTIQFIFVSVAIFSLWVAFALLAVNPYLYPYIPGYQVGQPCGWEFVALFASVGLAWFITRRWPAPTRDSNTGTITVSIHLIRFLLAYAVFAVALFLWQYAKWSANYN